MGARGPAPKDPEKRRRRNKPKVDEITTLSASEHSVDKPPMPSSYRVDGEGVKPLAATRDWWATWETSPQAAVFVATDWQRLAMLVPVVDQYFRTGDIDFLKELRLQEQKLGATPEDRQRLKWRVEPKAADPSPPDESASVSSIEERRQRLRVS